METKIGFMDENEQGRGETGENVIAAFMYFSALANKTIEDESLPSQANLSSSI